MTLATARSAVIRGALGATFVVVALAAPGFAHDSWLIAEKGLTPEPGPIGLEFVTSEDFPHPEGPTKADRVSRFVVVHDGGEAPARDVRAGEHALTAVLDAPRPGVYCAAIALRPRFIEIEGEAFTRYLEDERAAGALSVRASAGATGEPGLELYAKFSKAFVEVGAPTPGAAPARAESGVATRPVGHPLEIVPMTNPCRWRTGERVTVRVLLDGQPAPGLFVSSGREDGGHAFESTIRTNEAGFVSFTFSRPGLWYLRTHVIRPLKDVPPDAQGIPEGKTPQWASMFATVTFRVGAQ